MPRLRAASALRPGPAVAVEMGLRERKKLETRQRISDLATEMFIAQGFDEVRVADVAARAGVSEKTVYNYFPTKESLVFDQADAQLAEVLAAVRGRPGGTSATRAYAEALKAQMRQLFDEDLSVLAHIVPRFGQLIEAAPSLRAAWGDYRDREVTALAETLAGELGVDALDPEPRMAARALVSLTELGFDSVMRNVTRAASLEELESLLFADLERGVALIDRGIEGLRSGPVPHAAPPTPARDDAPAR